MCGVAAAIGRGADEQVESMVRSMAHRGIRRRVLHDWISSIGHVRLPIVGTGEDHDQPLFRGRWAVAFVGEVLDFRERMPGAECDADLVADTWSEEGPSGFQDFDGFWSVVAMDRSNGEVHCLVDYLSQKPLYVRSDEHAVAVASEPDAVAQLGPVSPDEVYLSAVVKWGYCPETWRTPYEGVRRMLPGEHAVLGPEGIRSLSRVDVLKPAAGTPDDLWRELEAAVRRRVLSSDVPTACLVSGGLDSSVVLALARRYGDVRAFHVENGEREWCDLAAPDAVNLTLDLGSDALARALDYHQEPIDLGSLVPQAALSDAVGREGYRVCLTGDGADEMLGGYGRSRRYDSQASDVWHELVAWHLPRLDRVMMRNLVEVRSPFLARRVAALCLGLPRDQRTGKRVLRELARGTINPRIIDREKVPLRTDAVTLDREARSQDLVRMFRERIACQSR